MPIYEYQCSDCGKQHEQIRRMAEADSGVECPQCKSAHSRRLLSTFATTSGSTSSQSGQQSAMQGCGMPSCCQITGGGCPN
ncbi:MAG: zinc ribbon domain-containing protein [Bryobacteraceae bacterium]|nr:zinc ribbon domain-containing protein [Bryobacteraceae bacterium]